MFTLDRTVADAVSLDAARKRIESVVSIVGPLALVLLLATGVS